MSQPDLKDLVENEVRWRLSEDPCPTCKRGANSHEMGATAIAQLTIGLARLEIAKAKVEPEDQGRSEMNPLALVATAQKLPAGHPKRAEIVGVVEGHIFALQEAVKSLK